MPLKPAAEILDTRERTSTRPKAFIGSSREGQDVAACIQQELGDEVDATGWWQGVFGLSESTIESLEQEAGTFDFAILVLTPDDPGEKRGRPCMLPRDNVMFELGLFIGVLGRSRIFVVRESAESLELPSDFSGVTTATFVRRTDHLRASLGPACTDLKAAMRRLMGNASDASKYATAAARVRDVVARRRRSRSLGTALTTGPRQGHQIADLSATGALLETNAAMEVGKLMDLDLSLGNKTTAHVTAKVVRVQQPDWGRVGGAGVHFTGYDGRSRELIEEYVNEDPNTWKLGLEHC